MGQLREAHLDGDRRIARIAVGLRSIGLDDLLADFVGHNHGSCLLVRMPLTRCERTSATVDEPT
jgi:hypothetical protein